jgi:starch synthase
LMKVLFVTTEVQGLVQVGGLADVARALPRALRDLGHDVRIVLPYYRQIASQHQAPVRIPSLRVGMGNSEVWCAVREKQRKDDEEVPTYFVEHNGFFDRPNLYDDGLLSYVDNADRFAFLSKAALELCKSLAFCPDIVNANDWTSALAPFFLKVHERDGFFQETACVLTIHSAFYQGKFFGDKRYFIGIPDEYFTADIIEDQHGVNFLKAGLYFADKINAVSPNYAVELLTPGGAHGLYTYFKRREEDIRGVLNGCDYSYWDPKTDDLIPKKYSANNFHGKAICKRELQKVFQLEEDENRPLFGMVCRLTNDKGFAYLIPALYDILKEDVAVVVLGVGDPAIKYNLDQLTANFGGKAGFKACYDERLAHWVYAGSDFFLMPSLFEACGSSQMYSMAYGTVPLVRAVGGLKDTVEDFNEDTGAGTGFVFQEPTAEALRRCVQRALHIYRNDQEIFRSMRLAAMRRRFKWSNTAERYLEMYEEALREKLERKG